MALSAADLQRRHELEGTPDPFPSLNDLVPVKASKSSRVQELDTESQSAFPSLASATTNSSATPVWGSAAGPRIKPAVNKQPLATDSFTLSDLHFPTSKDGRSHTLGEVMKQVMVKYKVKLEASGNQKTNQTTFYMKSESQKELDKAKRSLLAQLSPVITVVINAPASTIPSIIGPKGATLKQIRDQTNVKVDIPKRDTFTTNGNGHVSGDSASTQDEDDEEPTIPITIEGPQPLVHETQKLINQIIASKTSKTSQRVRGIPSNVLPFIAVRHSVFQDAADGGEVKLSLNQANREITVSGDREAVVRVVESIKSTIAHFSTYLTPIKISLPKRQHRLLIGKAADDIMVTSKCAVVVTSPDDPSDEVLVWGLGQDLPNGLAAVMTQANSKHIHEFPLPGPIAMSRQLLTYMLYISYPQKLSSAHPGVSIFPPTQSAIRSSPSLTIDIVGDKADVDAVVRKVSELIGKLIGATKDVPIDWLIHRVIQGKNAKKIKQFHDTHNVQVIFPAENLEQSSVLLVYDPFSPNASPSPDDKAKALDDASKDLLKLAKDAADVISQVIPVEQRWHEAVVGKGGTTLNAIIGGDKTLSIKVGADASDPSGEDVILVRGTRQDVERAVKEIMAIVENAKNDEIVSSYSTEFDVDREYVGRIVGAQGASVNKLRDQLGVKVDVSDEGDDKETGKKKKAHQRSKITITGRKENVEDAKRRILAQLERLVDETSVVLKIPAQYHSSLIGSGGKYAIRLEEKYSVKITFPRQSSDASDAKTREQLKSDEVLIKGGKKGVASAKAELLDAVEFEKESNNVLKFTVPTRAVARILGKGGAQINEIKDTTDAQIDVDKATDDASVSNITVRGTKKAVSAAKTAILAIADQIAEETTDSVVVEQKFHRSLIGAGGQGLRDLVQRCGIEVDNKTLAGLIRFPRQGEPSDEVRLRGDPMSVKKIKAELEKTAAALRDRVVLAVEVPASTHRVLIGRGGQHLNELQTRTGCQVQFPGSRSYAQVGEAENITDFKDVDTANIVKVTGTRSACEKGIEALKAAAKNTSPELITNTMTIPLKYHHAISQQGIFFRNLRSYNVQVEHSSLPKKSAVPTTPPVNGVNGNGSARIDDTETTESAEPAYQWIVSKNYEEDEDGTAVWTFKARDQEGLARALKATEDALKHAEQMTSIGFLTLPDRSMFPRIVGTKGSNVSRLRNETGADITVSRENTTIVIVGAENQVEAAKNAIVRMSTESKQQHRQRD